MKIDKKVIAQKIKNARINAGYTQSELSEKIGISEKHLSKIETGKYFPALDTFLNILDVLNLNLGDFGFYKESTSPQAKDLILNLIDNMSEQQLNTCADVINTLIKHI